jgi:hypothetical protein
VDPAFILVCASRLENMICVVEREAFQYLQILNSKFLSSVEYTLMIASNKAKELSNVKSISVHYYSYFLFIFDLINFSNFILLLLLLLFRFLINFLMTLLLKIHLFVLIELVLTLLYILITITIVWNN